MSSSPATNALDRAIGYFAPMLAMRRARARAHTAVLVAQAAALDSARLAYEGASQGRRASGWITSGASGNAEVGADLPRLRDRSRSLIRDNHFAARAASEFQTRSVGSGILARFDDATVQGRWDRWTPACSADGLGPFEAIESHVARAVFESGECLVRFRPRRSDDGMDVALQLQVLEPDHLDMGRTQKIATGYIIHGIEFDLLGRTVAYWLFPQHPGDVLPMGGSVFQSSRRVLAADVLHIYERHASRPGQVRGVPSLAAVLLALRNLDDWETAELIRKRTEACLAAVVSGPDAGETITPQLTDADGRKIETLSPGMVMYGSAGMTVTFSDPKAVGGYVDYKRSRVRDISAGIGIPYELVQGDLSQVNYSSYRAGLLAYRQRIEAFQWLCLIPQLCVPVERRFLEVLDMRGWLPSGEISAKWVPPEFDLLDRESEAKADSEMLANGTLSWPDAVLAKGNDPEKQLSEIEQWNPRLAKAGITFRKEAAKGATNGTDEQSQNGRAA